jgi:hypothetical protein
LLNEGQLIALDSVAKVTNQYIEQMTPAVNSVDIKNNALKQIFISRIKMYDANFQNKYIFNNNNRVGIGITIQNTSWPHPYTIGFGLNSLAKGRILISHKVCDPLHANTSEEFVVWLPTEELTPNIYTIDVSVLDDKKESLDLVTNALSFEIALANTKFEGLGYDYGIMAKELTWQNL